MPKLVRTARGKIIDFDALMIKHQLAQAPMNIEVARRKQFIDTKETKSKVIRDAAQAEADAAIAAYQEAETARLATLKTAAPQSPAEIEKQLETTLIEAEVAQEQAAKKAKK